MNGSVTAAANRDASVVAWLEGHHLLLRFMAGGEHAFRLVLRARHALPPLPWLAMQWAPDGRKLLLLGLEGVLRGGRTWERGHVTVVLLLALRLIPVRQGIGAEKACWPECWQLLS